MATEFDAYERVLWAGRAADYERVFLQQTRRMAEPLLDAVGTGPGVRLLDVGTGPGPVAAAAVARGAQVTAVDADPGMVALAARNVPDARVREGVLPELDLPYGEYNAVVGNFVINHVGEPDRVVAALRRHLRDGGRLALTCWHNRHTTSSILVRNALEKAGVPWPDDLPVTPFMELGEPGPFAALLEAAGLQAVGVEEFQWDHLVDPEEWWSGASAGVGSSGVVLRRLDAAKVAEVKTAYDGIVAGMASVEGRTVLPVCALLAVGTR
jgi:trans-aconitate methyltransferase